MMQLGCSGQTLIPDDTNMGVRSSYFTC